MFVFGESVGTKNKNIELYLNVSEKKIKNTTTKLYPHAPQKLINNVEEEIGKKQDMKIFKTSFGLPEKKIAQFEDDNTKSKQKDRSTICHQGF